MSNTDGNPQHCPASTRDGQPCKGKATASGWCVAHDPRANEWRARGGKGRSNVNRAIRLLPSRLAPLVVKLEAVFDELHETSGAARTAREAVALASIAVAICKVFDAGMFEERLRDIERRQAEAEREQARGA
jgi:hypothetical protein